MSDFAANVDGWPRQLTWSDFQERSVRPPKVEEHAQIKADIVREGGGIRWKDRGGQVWFAPDAGDTPLAVRVTVIEAETWVLEGGEDEPWSRRGVKSERLLRHEQGHFDLTGLAACKLYRQYTSNDLKASSQDAVVEEIRRLLKQIKQAAGELDERYDHETEHGLDEQAQERWNRRIRKAIQEERPEEFY